MSSSQAEIIVRHIQLEDVSEVHRLLTHPTIVHWTSEMPCVSNDAMYERLMHPPEGRYTLVAACNQQVVGTLGFSSSTQPRLRHNGHISAVAVHPECRGQGIGAALVKAAIDLADQWFNIHRLDLVVYTDNKPAIALYQKFGFIAEGVMKDYVFRAGKYADVQMMARFI